MRRRQPLKIIREAVGVGETQGETVIIATVHGDIHDIGKNIVKVLLENYGYRVLDLGKDVPVEAVVEAAKKTDAKVVGLCIDDNDSRRNGRNYCCVA